MIQKIIAKDFKGGIQFEQELRKITWLSGPNGSGKTARTQALQIAVQGYVPGFSKKPADIYNNFAGKTKLSVEFMTENGKRFGRELAMKPDGGTTAKYTAGGRKTSKEAFISSLATAGNPSVFDLKAFWALSDAKKIDELVTMSGRETLSGLIEEVSAAKTRINRIREEIKAREASVQQLNTALAQIDLPGTTLSEVSEKIKRTEAEIQEHRDAMKAEERRQKPDYPQDTQPAPAKPKKPDEVPVFGNVPEKIDPVVQVQRIMDTLEAAGCELCAAKVVTKDVLDKLGRKQQEVDPWK